MLREQSLTIAFEGVCREILGDHGQTPQLNYLVVTAVVDKGAPFARRFRDTRGVVDFCAEWGLPWNETFLYTTVEVHTTLCRLYAHACYAPQA